MDCFVCIRELTKITVQFVLKRRAALCDAAAELLREL